MSLWSEKSVPLTGRTGFVGSHQVEVKAALEKLQRELRVLNESAARTLQEGLEDTQALHRLDRFPELGQSVKNTNVLESVLAPVEQHPGKVDRWRNRGHKQC